MMLVPVVCREEVRDGHCLVDALIERRRRMARTETNPADFLTFHHFTTLLRDRAALYYVLYIHTLQSLFLQIWEVTRLHSLFIKEPL